MIEEPKQNLKEKFVLFQRETKRKERRKIFEHKRILYFSDQSNFNQKTIPLFEVQQIDSVNSLYNLREKLLSEQFNEDQLFIWAQKTEIVSSLFSFAIDKIKRQEDSSVEEISRLTLEICALLVYLSQKMAHALLEKNLFEIIALFLSKIPQDLQLIHWTLTILGNLVIDCGNCEKKVAEKNLVQLAEWLIEKNPEAFYTDQAIIEKMTWLWRAVQRETRLPDFDNIFEYFLGCLSTSPKMFSFLAKAIKKTIARYSFRQRQKCEEAIFWLLQQSKGSSKLQKCMLELQSFALQNKLNVSKEMLFWYIKNNLNVKENSIETQKLLSLAIEKVDQREIICNLLDKAFLKAIAKRVYRPHPIFYRQLCVENLCRFGLKVSDEDFRRYFFSGVFNFEMVTLIIESLFKEFAEEIQSLFLELLWTFFEFHMNDSRTAKKEELGLIAKFVHKQQASDSEKVYQQALAFCKKANKLAKILAL